MSGDHGFRSSRQARILGKLRQPHVKWNWRAAPGEAFPGLPRDRAPASYCL